MQPTDKRIATVEQWQALKGVIDDNIGKARVLTADDYNYHSTGDTDDSVALWLLEPGVYTFLDGSVIVKQHRYSTSVQPASIFLVSHTSGSTVLIVEFAGPGYKPILYSVNLSTGAVSAQRSLLRDIDVVDVLTSISTTQPLSANQGKVLKDLIDAIVVPTKTSDLTNDSDFQTSTDVSGAISTATGAIDTKLNSNVITDLTMATDATKVEFTENKKNLSTGATSTEVDTIPLASTTQAGILNAAGYQSIIDSQDRLDALAGGAVSIANLSANPSQSDLTTAWQTATGETTVFNRASIFDSTNGKNWTYFDNTSAWEVTGTVNQSITINNFSQGTAGLIVGDNTAGKVYAEQDGTGSVYGWDALNTRVTNVESATANIPSVVQTTGTSTTDVMSQNATTSMVFADPSTSTRVRIGNNAVSASTYSVALGYYAAATGSAGVAIGYGASASGRGSIAFSNATASGQGVVQFGARETINGYNNSNYRLLTGLYDPQGDHDAANKEYVDNLVVTYAALNGSAAPTTSTAGTYVGQLYLDTTNDKMYYLASIDDTADPVEYTWAEIGGSSVNVVQTTGTSTTDVMSQDATTKLIYHNYATTGTNQIAIGNPSQYGTGAGSIVIGLNGDTRSDGARSIAIGNYAEAGNVDGITIATGTERSYNNGSGTVIIGPNVKSNHNYSVALGSDATTTRAGEINVGAGSSGHGYNSSNYRVLGGLYDAQNDHDAVNLGQMNAAIAAAGGAEEISAADWSALWQ